MSRDLVAVEAHERAVQDWSQVEIEQMLMDRTREAARTRVELRRKAAELGHAKAAYKRVRAVVALRYRAQDIEDDAPTRGRGSITESIREARVDADDEVKDAALRYFIADAEFDATREGARLLQTEMSALQSILADLRPMVSER